MRVLLALDDNDASAAEALRYAGAGASLVVLFVMDATWNVFVGHDWLSGSNSRGDFLDWVRDEEQKAAEAAFCRFRMLAENSSAESTQPVVYEERLAAGNVCDEIAKAAQDADLLIVSQPFTRGLEVVRNASAKLLEQSPCSVLFVKKTADSSDV